MLLRPSMFQTDDALRLEIEHLVGHVWPQSEKAWEEYYHFTNFGLAQKAEGAKVLNHLECGIEQGVMIRVVAKTFAIGCFEPETVPLVRACLYGGVAAFADQYPKDKLHMHWRRKPETTSFHEFDTDVMKYHTTFRIGMWVDNGPDTEGITL